MDTTGDNKRSVFLVLRAQAGDRVALSDLLELHQNHLHGYLLSVLRDESLADDSLQATFLQVFRKLRWLREPAFFRVWLFRIASRIAFRLAKQRRNRNEISNFDHFDAVQSEVDSPGENVVSEEMISRIPEWLDRLTLNSREAIVLHYLKGFTVPQTADILGVPLATAKSRISYGLVCIRKFANKC